MAESYASVDCHNWKETEQDRAANISIHTDIVASMSSQLAYCTVDVFVIVIVMFLLELSSSEKEIT